MKYQQKIRLIHDWLLRLESVDYGRAQLNDTSAETELQKIEQVADEMAAVGFASPYAEQTINQAIRYFLTDPQLSRSYLYGPTDIGDGVGLLDRLEQIIVSASSRLTMEVRTSRFRNSENGESRWYAVRYDETSKYNKRMIEDEMGVAVYAIYDVYVTDATKVYIASMSPSAEMHLVDVVIEPLQSWNDLTEDKRNAIADMQIDLISNSNLTEYFSWYEVIGRIKKGGPDIAEYDDLSQNA